MLFQKLLDMKKHKYVRQDYCTKGEVMTENTKIGLDFGTTYSVLSRLKKGKDGHAEPEACALREGGSGAEIQDSIVLKDQNAKLFFGSSARNKVGRKRTTAYLKMLQRTEDFRTSNLAAVTVKRRSPMARR